MTYFTEDPTYVFVVLGLAALGCLIALQITQQGKFLIWAGGMLLVAGVVGVVERLVVTDSERIEAVVYSLADAALSGDSAAVEAHLDRDVKISRGDRTDLGLPLSSVLPLLSRVHFEVLKVRQLRASAGSQTKRGTAEFKVWSNGVFGDGMGSQPFPPTETQWALGFRETDKGVWRVTRITAIRLPNYVAMYLGRGR